MVNQDKLTIQQIMTVLLRDDDEERVKFIKDHQSSIKPAIKLALRMILSENIDEKIASVRCLAKISEINYELLMDMFNDPDTKDACQSMLTTIRDFILSPSSLEEADQKQKELIKCYLILLVNLTRRKEFDQTFVQSLLGEDALQGFHQTLINSSNIKQDEDIYLIVSLLLNLSRFSCLLDMVKVKQSSLSSSLEQLLKQFEKSQDPKTRCCLISIIVNFLIPGNEAQETMLNPKLELIPKILYPLAGPTETEFDEEDMAQLPLDLQYLPPDQEREKDSKVRDSLISCLLLCCNTKLGRESLKKNGTYYILRELHKWEKDRPIQKRIEDVVDILIKEEEEFNDYPDLKSVSIPNHLLGKFDEMDQTLVNDD